jgi:LmbE family N-acetylglucosaminyl deacetylase
MDSVHDGSSWAPCARGRYLGPLSPGPLPEGRHQVRRNRVATRMTASSSGPPARARRRSAGARRRLVRLLRATVVLLARPWVMGPGPCLVLAPHADDESLGCGGTIAALRERGRRVVVAVATDGSLSDSLGRAPVDVAAAREREALAACAELGVPAEDVRFLRLPDGALAQHHDALVEQLERLGDEVHPREVLVPSVLDPHPDHRALHRACGEADLGDPVVHEYLVWAWPSWPLSERRLRRAGGGDPRSAGESLVSLLRRGRRSHVARFRGRKAASISRYASQLGDGTPGKGIPPQMVDEFGGRFELFLGERADARTLSMVLRSLIAPGSRPRAWLRAHAPRVRALALAPRRALHRRRWVRRHEEVSAEDRPLLTETILPALRDRAAGADVLFVGVEWYTAGYPALFPAGNLVTMDIDDAVARHGGPRHLTADVLELGRYVDDMSFDSVVCNGVLGHGVDAEDDVRRALDAMCRCLRPDGLLVVGWNDTAELRVPGLEAIAASVGLEPTAGAGLPTWRTGPLGPLRHTYDVYRRSAAGGPSGPG